MRRHCGSDDGIFGRKIESWVAAAIDAGASDFDDLIRRLPGVYPTAVSPALAALSGSGHLDTDTLSRLQPRRVADCPTGAATGSLLPLPHPLNYEWRFAAESSRLLLELAEDIRQPGESVLMFGTPGVVLEALLRPLDRPMTFFGEDNPVTRRLAALNEAVGHPVSVQLCSSATPIRESAGVVIVDPPWYFDFIRPMLATSAAACRLGGYILISLAPEGARPTATQDRARVLALAERLGLSAITAHTLALTYETPFFEANALAASGVLVQNLWRRGDLVIFRKVRDTNRPIVLTSVRKARWCEVEIGRMRVFVRREATAGGTHTLQSLVEGDVLPTVSRRDRRRGQAQVWTSGNRVFASAAPDLVLTAALAVSNEQRNPGSPPRLWGSIVERDEVERLGYALRALAVTEAKEERATHAAAEPGWSTAWTSTSMTFCRELTETASG